MKLLAILLLAFSLAAQVNSTASASLLAAGAPAAAAPHIVMEPSLPAVALNPAVSPGRTFYRWSLAILAASSAADAASSWNLPEANPMLATPGSKFGAGSAAIKLGLLGSAFLLEHLVVSHHPELYRRVAWLNFGLSGALGAVVQHNVSVR
jgi:hypothetical protein